MKLLQNKSTGEIGCLICSFGKTPEKITVVEYIDGKRGSRVWYYDSLAELNEEWEDYQESESFWYISSTGTPIKSEVSIYDPLEIHLMKRIGNYFESEEDVDDAVEKLVAWKRLKDNCGISFSGLNMDRKGRPVSVNLEFNNEGRTTFDEAAQNVKDLTLLFGGKR